MSRRITASLVTALASLAALPGAAGAAAEGPALNAHPIFSGRVATFHVGALLQVGAAHGAPKFTEICFDPAPIDRPACSTSVVGAPAAPGRQTLTATFADGSTSSLTITVHRAATKVGGPTAVPGHVTCPKVRLYGSYPPHGHSMGAAPRGADVAMYNRVGGGIFLWDYRTNANGFGTASCATPGLAKRAG
jgi:hypothetical protein